MLIAESARLEGRRAGMRSGAGEEQREAAEHDVSSRSYFLVNNHKRYYASWPRRVGLWPIGVRVTIS
jgi:hypothetical protein